MHGKTSVLFLCTGNSARSQMAEALLRHHGGEQFEALSAGTHPKPVHALTFKVLEEAGVNIAGLRSKDIMDFLGRRHIGYVVIVCADAAAECPTVWPGADQTVHLRCDDPAACKGTPDEQLQEFRRIRDEIEAWVREWIPTVAPKDAETELV